MSIQINAATYLDERYSPKVIETLRSMTFLQPGLTYNADYQGDASSAASVTFHVPSAAAVAASAVGGDYSGVEFGDSLVTVNICNAIRKQTKIRGFAAASVAYDHGAVVMKETSEDVREGRDRVALAALVSGATASSDTAAITSTNVRGLILSDIAALKKAKAKPDVLLISTDALTALIQSQTAGAGPFTPETNEEAIKAGSIGRLYGCSVIENNELGISTNTAIALYTDVSTSSNVSIAKVDWVVYDHRFFGMLNHLTEVAIKDTPNFAGSVCNIEDNVGLKVLKAAGVVKHAHA